MFNSSLVVRTLGRRALTKSLRTNVVSQQVGAIRFSSYFTPAHEYVKVEGTVGVCGITDYAQSALGDIVFVELPSVGDEFEAGDSFGSVESVKAASDVYAPVSGTIIEVNEALEDSPELVNSSAEDDAWFVKIEMNDTSEVNELMDETAYEEHCENE